MVPMKVASKLIHGGPVHFSYIEGALYVWWKGGTVRVQKALCVGVLKEIKKNRNKQIKK